MKFRFTFQVNPLRNHAAVPVCKIQFGRHPEYLIEGTRKPPRTWRKPGGRFATRTLSGRFVAEYKFANYFEQKVLLKRPYLRKEWCIAVVEQPLRSEPQGDSRYRFWASVPELGGRYLRVVTLADMVTILNAFPDRGFKP